MTTASCKPVLAPSSYPKRPNYTAELKSESSHIKKRKSVQHRLLAASAETSDEASTISPRLSLRWRDSSCQGYRLGESIMFDRMEKKNIYSPGPPQEKTHRRKSTGNERDPNHWSTLNSSRHIKSFQKSAPINRSLPFLLSR